VRFSHWWFIWL